MTTTTNKGYTTPTVGGDFNSWGTELNGDLGIIDNNLGGLATVNVAGNSNVTASAPQAQCLVQRLTGALTGNINYLLPQLGALYIIDNETTGAFSIAVKTTANAAGVVVAQNGQTTVWSDGTNIITALSVSQIFAGNITINGTLTVGGATVLSSTLHVGAGATFDANVLVLGGIAVTTASSFSSTVHVVGATTLDGTLAVGNAAAFNSTLSANGTITSNGNIVSTNGTQAVGLLPNGGIVQTVASVSSAICDFIATGFGQIGTITGNGAGGTAYNTTSDYRLKIVHGRAKVGTLIDAVPVHDAAFKVMPADHRPMFLAHELAQFAPWAVTGAKDATDITGDVIPQMVDHPSLIAVLWAAVQSLRSRVAALENGFVSPE